MVLRRPTTRSILSLASLCRNYSASTGPVKASAKLVGELRKHTEVSITKAREALSAANNDVERALEWLRQDLAVSGARKAEKVASRVAGEGLLAVSVLGEGWGVGHGGVRAALIELNCETDFVARSEMFNFLAAHVAYTTAYLAEPPARSDSAPFLQTFPLDVLYDAPLLSKSSTSLSGTVTAAIQEAISKVGEKIAIRRATSFVCDPLTLDTVGLRMGAYVHGGNTIGEDAQTGRVASLVALGIKSPSLLALKSSEKVRADLSSLSRSLARQVVGFETLTIRSPGAAALQSSSDPEATALYSQPFMMLSEGSSESSVESVLRSWARERGLGDDEETGVEVLEMVKWTACEGIEKSNDFAEEVKRLSATAAPPAP